MAKVLKYRTCNLCEALCGLEIEVENNQAISIRGDKEDVFSKGHICPKAVALKDIHEDPDRLKFPLQKRNGKWIEVSWEHAFHEVAKNILKIQSNYGNDALGIYQGNPSIHNLGTSLFSPVFVRSLRTKNRFSATSVDQLAHHLAAEYMLGHMNLLPVPDLDHTDFWLILGGNPMVSNGSLMTVPNVSGRMKNIQERGGKIVVIDPRRTETARKSDQHIFIQPGTDIYLLLGMLKRITDQNRMNLDHVIDYIDHDKIDQLQKIISRFSYKTIVDLTGIELTTIFELTDKFLASPRAVCYGRLGVSATDYGGLCHWAINLINIISGNFDVPGGAMLTTPAIDVAGRKSKQKRFGRWHSRVRGLPETGGELPSSAMAEEILTPGDGQIKAMITSCGNPILSTPNGRKLDQAFEKLEFTLSIDIYLNETTRHADIILPPATGLETPHYSLAFHNLAIRNTARYSEAVLEKEPGTKYDWEIFAGLLKEINRLKGMDPQSMPFLNETPQTLLAKGLSSGSSGISFQDLKNELHGIDMGPLRSQLPGRLQTEDQRLDIFPEIYKEQLMNLPQQLRNQDSLLMIGRRHLRSNNSWMHNSLRMVKGRDRCTAIIHPLDAREKSIENGQDIAVESKVGRIVLKAEVSDEIARGSISIPHGWGHNRRGTKMKIAQDHAGVSMNDLVDDQHVDQLTGASVINGIPVQIMPLCQDA